MWWEGSLLDSEDFTISVITQVLWNSTVIETSSNEDIKFYTIISLFLKCSALWLWCVPPGSFGGFGSRQEASPGAPRGTSHHISPQAAPQWVVWCSVSPWTAAPAPEHSFPGGSASMVPPQTSPSRSGGPLQWRLHTPAWRDGLQWGLVQICSFREPLASATGVRLLFSSPVFLVPLTPLKANSFNFPCWNDCVVSFSWLRPDWKNHHYGAVVMLKKIKNKEGWSFRDMYWNMYGWNVNDVWYLLH